MRKRKPNNRRLSIYLIKAENRDFSDIVKSGTEEYEVKHRGQTLGTLFIKPLRGKCPSWFSLFEKGVTENMKEKLSSRNVSAVFLLKREERIFALTFGFGRYLLKPEIWEERFGLKVVLNTIDREKVRIIERKNLDTMLTQTRTQTSRECAIEEFSLDVQQILLKAVTGEPRDALFASRVAGADALSITCEVTLDTIENKCDEILKDYTAKDYQKSFPWVDNLTEITNKQKTEKLNVELIERIKADNVDQLFLAVPDIVEWTNIDGFKFLEREDDVHPDIFLHDFINTVRDRDNLTVQYLKQRRVFAVRADTGFVEDRWTVYRCLNCEIADSGKTYILTEGKWYEVEASFVYYVNKQMEGIAKSSISLLANRGEKEADYCQRLYESNKAFYALMDGKMIWYGGGRSQIEFCDLFTKDNKLIHLKRYAGSSVLSHLFSQGANCARAFLADIEFRKSVISNLPESHKFDVQKSPVSRDYEIVFGIISETADFLPDKLPFFSKITLMRVKQELSEVMGFKTSLAGIKVIP